MGTSASSACLKAPRPYLAPSRPLQLRETRLFVRLLAHFPGIQRNFETLQGRPRQKGPKSALGNPFVSAVRAGFGVLAAACE